MQETVERFFVAMQAGQAQGEALFSLFADDAEYIEPFSGSAKHHVGITQIRAAFEAGWETPLPDMSIVVDRVDVDGAVVRAHWTCVSPALPGGAMSGLNVFHIDEGRIRRLETTFA